MYLIYYLIVVVNIFTTVKVSFLARDRERTVPMYIPDIYQNDLDEKLDQKKHKFDVLQLLKCLNLNLEKIYFLIWFFTVRILFNSIIFFIS